MVTERLKDKTAHNHEIIERAGYNAKNAHTRAQIYLENMRKPEIRSLLEPIVNEVEQVLIDNVRQFKDSETPWKRQLSNDNAKWIRDAVKGKAIQQVHTTSTGVTLNLDLTSSLVDEPAD